MREKGAEKEVESVVWVEEWAVWVEEWAVWVEEWAVWEWAVAVVEGVALASWQQCIRFPQQCCTRDTRSTTHTRIGRRCRE